MAITCPACNKANQTEAVCVRCGCDLSELYRVLAAAAVVLGEAERTLRETDWDGALRKAERSWCLCHTVEAARLAFLATAALGCSQAALTWRERANASRD